MDLLELKLFTGQIVGIIATIITAISYQAKTKKWLLIIQSLSIICTFVSYLLLGAMSGFALNVICLVRNVCFFFQKEGKMPIYISTAIFSIAMIVFGIVSWQNVFSLLVIIALVINTIFLSLGKPQLLRYSILLTSPMVLVYNVVVFTIGGILNESLAIISSIIGIIRFRNQNKN